MLKSILDLLIYLDTISSFFGGGGGKHLFQLTSYRLSLWAARAGTQSWDLEGGTDTEPMKKNDVHWLAWLSFLYSPKLTCLGMTLL